MGCWKDIRGQAIAPEFLWKAPGAEKCMLIGMAIKIWHVVNKALDVDDGYEDERCVSMNRRNNMRRLGRGGGNNGNDVESACSNRVSKTISIIYIGERVLQ